MPRGRSVIVAYVLAVGACAAADDVTPPPLVFEGFGLGDLSAGASVAEALRTAGSGPAVAPTIPLDVSVNGPGPADGGSALLTAELRGHVERFAVAAGLEGDAAALAGRTPRWTGRIGVGGAGPGGADLLEVRTRLDAQPGAERFGIELGPRIERRLPGGVRVFLDGAATAEAIRAADGGGWQLPGTTTADSLSGVGISARTGIVR